MEKKDIRFTNENFLFDLHDYYHDLDHADEPKDKTEIQCSINGVRLFAQDDAEFFVDNLRYVPDTLDYIYLQCGDVRTYRADGKNNPDQTKFNPIIEYFIGVDELIHYYADIGHIFYQDGYLDLTPFVRYGKISITFVDGDFSSADFDLPILDPKVDEKVYEEYERRKKERLNKSNSPDE